MGNLFSKKEEDQNQVTTDKKEQHCQKDSTPVSQLKSEDDKIRCEVNGDEQEGITSSPDKKEPASQSSTKDILQPTEKLSQQIKDNDDADSEFIVSTLKRQENKNASHRNVKYNSTTESTGTTSSGCSTYSDPNKKPEQYKRKCWFISKDEGCRDANCLYFHPPGSRHVSKTPRLQKSNKVLSNKAIQQPVPPCNHFQERRFCQQVRCKYQHKIPQLGYDFSLNQSKQITSKGESVIGACIYNYNPRKYQSVITSLVIATDHERLIVLRYDNMEEIKSIDMSSAISIVQSIFNQSIIAVGLGCELHFIDVNNVSDDCSIKIKNAHNGNISAIQDMTIDQFKHCIVTGSEDGEVKVWALLQTRQAQELCSIKLKHKVTCMQTFDRGTIVVGLQNGDIYCLQMNQQTLRLTATKINQIEKEKNFSSKTAVTCLIKDKNQQGQLVVRACDEQTRITTYRMMIDSDKSGYYTVKESCVTQKHAISSICKMPLFPDKNPEHSQDILVAGDEYGYITLHFSKDIKFAFGGHNDSKHHRTQVTNLFSQNGDLISLGREGRIRLFHKPTMTRNFN